MYYRIILTILLLSLLAGSAEAQSIDSTIIPVIESWDTTCQCYTDNFILYIVNEPDSLNDSLVINFGYREAGKDLWFAALSFTDSTGAQVAIRAAMINKVDPFDVNHDGELSIYDLTLMIRRLFFDF